MLKIKNTKGKKSTVRDREVSNNKIIRKSGTCISIIS